MKCWVLVLVFISSTLVHSSQDFSCDNLKAQESVDLTKVNNKKKFIKKENKMEIKNIEFMSIAYSFV